MTLTWRAASIRRSGQSNSSWGQPNRTLGSRSSTPVSSGWSLPRSRPARRRAKGRRGSPSGWPKEQHTATVIAQAVRRGDVRPIDAERAARFFWSSWNGVLAPARHREAVPADVAVEIEAALQMLIGGLASDQARKRTRRSERSCAERPPAADRAGGGSSSSRESRLRPTSEPSSRSLPCGRRAAGSSPGPTPRPVKERLATLSNRFSGSTALNLRRAPVPWAYRVFFRQLGIDPDERRTPVEEVALQRLHTGGFQSRSLLDDALLIAVVETGVPVLALDADRLDAASSRSASARADERLGGDGAPLASGQLLIADNASGRSPFGDIAEGRGVTDGTRRIPSRRHPGQGRAEHERRRGALWTASRCWPRRRRSEQQGIRERWTAALAVRVRLIRVAVSLSPSPGGARSGSTPAHGRSPPRGRKSWSRRRIA